MNDESLKNGLALFLCRDKEHTLSKPVILGGFVHATDGRIAFKAKLTGAQDDCVPKKYPIESLQKLLHDAEAATHWHAINWDEFDSIEKDFMQKFREERIKDNRQYEDRYKEMLCPHCGEDLYWDTWSDALVKEKEERDPIEERDVSVPFKLYFGNERYADFSFAYFYLMRHVFGKELFFALEDIPYEKNPHLYIKIPEANAFGILMPMKCADRYDPKHVIHSTEVGE